MNGGSGRGRIPLSGWALVMAVVARAVRPGRTEVERLGPDDGTSVAARHAAMARELFP